MTELTVEVLVQTSRAYFLSLCQQLLWQHFISQRNNLSKRPMLEQCFLDSKHSIHKKQTEFRGKLCFSDTNNLHRQLAISIWLAHVEEIYEDLK